MDEKSRIEFSIDKMKTNLIEYLKSMNAIIRENNDIFQLKTATGDIGLLLTKYLMSMGLEMENVSDEELENFINIEVERIKKDILTGPKYRYLNIH